MEKEKTVAQLLRSTEDQANAFSQRVQDILGYSVDRELIASVMAKVKSRDIASPQKVAEAVSQYLDKKNKLAERARAVAERADRVRAEKAAAAAEKAAERAARTAGRSSRASGAARQTAEQEVRVDGAAVAEIEPPPADRSPLAHTPMEQIDEALTRNWEWAVKTQNYQVPPKHWEADEFVKEVWRRVFSEKAPAPKILSTIRRLHSEEWYVSPGAVADTIEAELAENEA